MAGKVLELINQLIDARAKGNAVVATTTRTKLLLKGIKVQDWTPSSPDDADMLRRVREIAAEMNINL